MKKLPSSRLEHYVPPVMVSIVFMFSCVYFYFFLGSILNDPDVPWHIIAGDYIRTHKAIPRYDPWSFTAENTTWYNLSWLWDVMLSALNEYAGIDSLMILNVFLGATLLASLMWVLTVQRRFSIDSGLFLVIITALTLLTFLTLRPQIFTYGAALFFHALLHATKTSLKIKKAYIILPAVMVLWVNMHGGFLAGFIVLLAFIGEAWHLKNHRYFIHLLMISALCVLACLCNPYGLDIIQGVKSTLGSKITAYISEWHPFTYGRYLAITLEVMLFIFVTNLRDNSSPLADRALAIIWLVMGLDSVRHMMLFALLAAPYMGFHLHAILTPASWPKMDRPFQKIGFFLVALLVFSLGMHKDIREFLKIPSPHMDKVIDLREEMAFIEQLPYEKRVYNEYGLGGPLIYLSKGTFPVFIDGRAGTAYPEPILQQAIYLIDDFEKFLKGLDHFRINVALIQNSKNVKSFMWDTGWKIAYKGKAATILVREDSHEG